MKKRGVCDCIRIYERGQSPLLLTSRYNAQNFVLTKPAGQTCLPLKFSSQFKTDILVFLSADLSINLSYPRIILLIILFKFF